MTRYSRRFERLVAIFRESWATILFDSIAHYAELQAKFKGRIIHGPEGGDGGREDTAQQGHTPDGTPPRSAKT